MRVVWKNVEKRTVFDNMVYHLVSNPTLSNKQVLQQGQSILPYERRGKVTDQRAFTFKAMINEARAAADKIREEKQMAARAAAAKPLEPPAPEPRKLDTLGEVFELFIDALADRIIDKMIKAKEQHEQHKPQPEHSLNNLFGGDPMEELEKVFDSLYPAFKKAPVQPRKPTVLVIGLNGHQMECIKQSRSDLDFMFLTGEQALSHYTVNKDHTILMTKFINHSAQAKYRKHPNLHYCNGGVSDLKHMLNVVFSKEAA